MAKTATIQARIEPALKAKVEKILHKLGMSATDAISLLYSQIALQKGMPFDVKVPNKSLQKTLREVDARKNLKQVSREEFKAMLGLE
jgi:DNA-damage-inducible protein J